MRRRFPASFSESRPPFGTASIAHEPGSTATARPWRHKRDTDVARPRGTRTLPLARRAETGYPLRACEPWLLARTPSALPAPPDNGHAHAREPAQGTGVAVRAGRGTVAEGAAEPVGSGTEVRIELPPVTGRHVRPSAQHRRTAAMRQELTLGRPGRPAKVRFALATGPMICSRPGSTREPPHAPKCDTHVRGSQTARGGAVSGGQHRFDLGFGGGDVVEDDGRTGVRHA
jgi:hypothetical protein